MAIAPTWSTSEAVRVLAKCRLQARCSECVPASGGSTSEVRPADQ